MDNTKIDINTNTQSKVCICPECKNDVNLASFGQIKEGMVIECNMCGVTLEVKEIGEGKIKTEIVDEGK